MQIKQRFDAVFSNLQAWQELAQQRPHYNHSIRWSSEDKHYYLCDNECIMFMDITGITVQSNLADTLHDCCNVHFALDELEEAYNFFCSVSSEEPM